jgi:phosphonate transport system substrate-binding protein
VKKLIPLLLLVFVLGCGAQPAEEPLIFVVTPDESTETMHARWEGFVAYIGEQVGRETELVVTADYAAAIEAMKYGHADVGYYGSFGYIIAAEEADIEVIVAEVSEKTGSATFRAYILARADSDIMTLDDLNGKTFGFVDIGSTSGYLFPNYALIASGVELGETFFAGTHPAAIAAVKNGSVDACGTSEYKIQAALEEGIIEEGELRVLWESDPIPGPNWAVQASMAPELKQAMTDAFANMPKEVILKPGVAGYIPATDSDFDFIRDVQAVVGD